MNKYIFCSSNTDIHQKSFRREPRKTHLQTESYYILRFLNAKVLDKTLQGTGGGLCVCTKIVGQLTHLNHRYDAPGVTISEVHLESTEDPQTTHFRCSFLTCFTTTTGKEGVPQNSRFMGKVKLLTL